MTVQHITQTLVELGISLQAIEGRNLVAYEETSLLELVETGEDGRKHFLIREAVEAWRRLKAAAKRDGENIYIVSAFRSISRQTEIIKSKIEKGERIEDIIKICAPPGFSEHHTGRALDLSTSGVENLSEEFEKTSAFEWLNRNAGQFLFSLSYPRGNVYGYQYEPWHWCYNVVSRGES